MKQILKIERKGNKHIITFSDSTLINVSSDIIKRFSLSAGQLISDRLLDQIIKYIDYLEAKKTAFRLLSIRNHTAFELKQKLLRKKKISKEIIESVITELTDTKYVNEQTIVVDYINEMIRKGFGPMRIKVDLKKKGIDINLLEDELRKHYDYNKQKMTILKLLDKKHFQLKSISVKDKQKVYTYFYNRGFSYEIISKCLGEMHD